MVSLLKKQLRKLSAGRFSAEQAVVLPSMGDYDAIALKAEPWPACPSAISTTT